MLMPAICAGASQRQEFLDERHREYRDGVVMKSHYATTK
jgi:hypothetical protein